MSRIDGRLASRHRFRHVLFQRYLYDRLDEAQRMRLHEATGRALEALYEGRAEPPIVDRRRQSDEDRELLFGELCDRIGPTPTAAMALIGMAQGLMIRAACRAAADACHMALALAEQLDDDALRVLAATKLGYCMMWAGDLATGHRHLDAAHHRHDPARDAWLAYAFGIEPGAEALVWDATNTMMRGLPTEAMALGDAALAFARQLDHPFTLCHVLAVEWYNRLTRGEYDSAPTLVDELEAIAAAEHFPFWLAGVDVYRGLCTGLLTDAGEGVALMRRGLEAWHAAGVKCHVGFFTAHLAELEQLRGDPQRGLEIVDATLAEDTDEQLSRVNLQVQRGRLLRLVGDERAAEALAAAITAARAAGARLHEVRGATELALLLDGAGRRGEAHEVLAPALAGLADQPSIPDASPATFSPGSTLRPACRRHCPG